MKKTKVINSDISRVIAQMGHFDKLSIGDAGMPVPRGTDVLNNVLEELEVQKIYLAEEIKENNPKILTQITDRLPNTPVEFIPHSDMKAELNNCHAFIRTGEMTPYANILLESNVVF